MGPGCPGCPSPRRQRLSQLWKSYSRPATRSKAVEFTVSSISLQPRPVAVTVVLSHIETPTASPFCFTPESLKGDNSDTSTTLEIMHALGSVTIFFWIRLHFDDHWQMKEHPGISSRTTWPPIFSSPDRRPLPSSSPKTPHPMIPAQQSPPTRPQVPQPPSTSFSDLFLSVSSCLF